MRKGDPPIETTAHRITIAREQQLAARRAGDMKLERAWTDALDRLLTIYSEEKKAHANT